MNKHILLLLILFLPSVGFAQSALVIKNISVVDVKADKIIRNTIVVIQDRRIKSVGRELAIPKNATIIDGKGKYLIPGLWDMHVHSLTDRRYKWVFPLLIASGITGVREMASNLPVEEINQIRKDIQEGKMLGPRFGALAYRLFDGPGTQFTNVAIEVSTPEQARELVRKYKQSGTDFIKPYNLLSRDAYLAIVDEAKKQKVPLEGHVPFSMTPKEVSDLGQRSIEHNFGVLLYCSKNEAELRKQTQAQPDLWGRFEAQAAGTYDTLKAHDLYRQFVHNDTWACPTIVIYRPLRFGSDSDLMQNTLLQYIPKLVREGWHETYTLRIMQNVPNPEDRKLRDQMRMFIVGDMYHTGVHLLAGTDMPNPYTIPGFSLHEELELLVQSGLPPIEALRTATLNPAKFFGNEKDWGTVEKGKVADLVLLNANPLENISNTRKIDAVIVNGKLLQRNDLDVLLKQVKELAMK